MNTIEQINTIQINGNECKPVEYSFLKINAWNNRNLVIHCYEDPDTTPATIMIGDTVMIGEYTFSVTEESWLYVRRRLEFLTTEEGVKAIARVMDIFDEFDIPYSLDPNRPDDVILQLMGIQKWVMDVLNEKLDTWNNMFMYIILYLTMKAYQKEYAGIYKFMVSNKMLTVEYDGEERKKISENVKLESVDDDMDNHGCLSGVAGLHGGGVSDAEYRLLHITFDSFKPEQGVIKVRIHPYCCSKEWRWYSENDNIVVSKSVEELCQYLRRIDFTKYKAAQENYNKAISKAKDDYLIDLKLIN